VGNFYGTHAELAAVQLRHRDSWYAANDEYWASGGYGGATDDEAMIGDGGGAEDAEEGLAFLDRLLAGHGDRVSRRPFGMTRAVDAGAGVGRVTKLVLLKRYGAVRLVEADEAFSKRSRAYLGKKRSGRCQFVCARLESLEEKAVSGWGARADMVWVQWTLQYLTDVDAVDTLRILAGGLVPETGIMIVKENRPFGAARLDRFQMETPNCSGRYDITRTDSHHRLLFQRAGLVVDLAEEGVETNTYALVVGGRMDA